jgi:hypothetical protein
MPNISFNDAHHALHRLAGEWRGRETISPSPWDPAGAVTEAVVRNRVALDGSVVIQEYDQAREGKVVFQGHGVFGVEGTGVVLRWWDNWSATPREFRGVVDGESVILVSPDPKGQARATWHLGDQAYDYSLEVSPDGVAWTSYLTATYSRMKLPA